MSFGFACARRARGALGTPFLLLLCGTAVLAAWAWPRSCTALPEWLVVAAALAAGMSSLDSSINAISTVWVVDIYRRHVVKDAEDRHYLHVAWAAAGAASLFMLGGAVAMLEADSTTFQDRSIQLTALLGGGVLGIYLIGFFTRLGDARAIWCGIVTTLAYTLWTMGILPLPIEVKFDLYYAAIFGNLVMFLIGFTAGLVFRRRTPLAPDLSIWGR